MRAGLENTPGTFPRDALHNTARARRGRDREKLLVPTGDIVDVKLLNAGRRVDFRGAGRNLREVVIEVHRHDVRVWWRWCA